MIFKVTIFKKKMFNLLTIITQIYISFELSILVNREIKRKEK